MQLDEQGYATQLHYLKHTAFKNISQPIVSSNIVDRISRTPRQGQIRASFRRPTRGRFP